MIKLNEKFECKRDKYQWILTEQVAGVNPKTKQPTINTRDTYHSNLGQCINTAICRTAGDCESLEELKTLLSGAQDGLLAALNQGE